MALGIEIVLSVRNGRRTCIALGVSLCDDEAMTHDTARLVALGRQRADLAAKLAALTPEFHAEILTAHAAGIGTVEVARLAGVTRDAVRQLVNRQVKA